MLVATATLIAVLILGAGMDFYFIESLEQGVKKEVVDKSRRKEINSLLSDYKKNVKSYNKVKKSYLKDLEYLTLDQYTTADDFEMWSAGLDSITINHQLYAIDTRNSVVELLTEDEWDHIILREKSRMLNEYDKTVAKKHKDPLGKYFEYLEQFIDESDMHEMDKFEAIENLNQLHSELGHLGNFQKEAQLEFSSLILDQQSSELEFIQILIKHDGIRSNSYNSLVNMHYTMSNNLSEKEWNKFVGKISKKV